MINIPQEIGVKYHDFGLFLLEDDTGARIRSIAHKHMNDAEQINMEVLRQWITGKGKYPIIWKTLIEVLHDIELNVLAGEIEAAKCHQNREVEAIEVINRDVAGNTRPIKCREKLEEKNNGGFPIRVCEGNVQKELKIMTTKCSEQTCIRRTPAECCEIGNKVVDIATDMLATNSEADFFGCDLDVVNLKSQPTSMYHVVHPNQGGVYKCVQLLVSNQVKEEHHRSSTLHEVSEHHPLQSQRERLEQTGTGDGLASGIEDVEYSEALQQIADIAEDLHSRCLEFASKERNQRNSDLHRHSEEFPTQESLMHSPVEVINDSEWKDNLDEALQQIVDIPENPISRCFELLDFQNSPRAGTAQVSVQEGFEDIPSSGIEYAKFYEALQVVVDVAAKLVSRCFDFELCLANQERVKKTALHGVREDTFAHHGVREIKTDVANSTKQESVRYESASTKSKETIRQIADIAIDLLCRSSKLQTRIQTKSQSYPPVH